MSSEILYDGTFFEEYETTVLNVVRRAQKNSGISPNELDELIYKAYTYCELKRMQSIEIKSDYEMDTFIDDINSYIEEYILNR